MDIKFHEGDFVENNDGRVGYISAICQCDECCKRGFYEPKIEYTDGLYYQNFCKKYSIEL